MGIGAPTRGAGTRNLRAPLGLALEVAGGGVGSRVGVPPPPSPRLRDITCHAPDMLRHRSGDPGHHDALSIQVEWGQPTSEGNVAVSDGPLGRSPPGETPLCVKGLGKDGGVRVWPTAGSRFSPADVVFSLAEVWFAYHTTRPLEAHSCERPSPQPVLEHFQRQRKTTCLSAISHPNPRISRRPGRHHSASTVSRCPHRGLPRGESRQWSLLAWGD